MPTAWNIDAAKFVLIGDCVRLLLILLCYLSWVGRENSPPTCQKLIPFFSLCFDIVSFVTASVMSDKQKLYMYVHAVFPLFAICSSCCVEFCRGGRRFGRGVRDYVSSLRGFVGGWVCNEGVPLRHEMYSRCWKASNSWRLCRTVASCNKNKKVYTSKPCKYGWWIKYSNNNYDLHPIS